jgi:hypothetical protein
MGNVITVIIVITVISVITSSTIGWLLFFLLFFVVDAMQWRPLTVVTAVLATWCICSKKERSRWLNHSFS